MLHKSFQVFLYIWFHISTHFSAFKQNTSYSTFDKIHFVVTQKSVLLTNINTSPSEASDDNTKMFF